MNHLKAKIRQKEAEIRQKKAFIHAEGHKLKAETEKTVSSPVGLAAFFALGFVATYFALRKKKSSLPKVSVETNATDVQPMVEEPTVKSNTSSSITILDIVRVAIPLLGLLVRKP